MFDWLLVFMPMVPHAQPPQKDYIGVAAAEVAYVALLPDTPVKKPLVDTKDCKTCNGVGRVRTGDNQGWTDCPDCETKNGNSGSVKTPGPLPSMRLQVQPLPPVVSGTCDKDGCTIPAK